MASWCALAKTSLADSLALARTSSASSAALAWISSASFLVCSRRSAAHWSRRRHLSVAWYRRAQPLLRRASSAARALAAPLQRAPVMAASTPVHASSASTWGSAAILGGLPKISGRGGDEALEGPGSVEVAPFRRTARGLSSHRSARLARPEVPPGCRWCWLSWGQQALSPWSPVCPLR
jgi:hypothetical protein